jgi:tRNA pseudouridine38-40 synthase
MRIALGVEYNGSQFCGWQRQSNAETVQQRLEEAISIVANTPTTTTAAGRTDTGVHATEQIVHFDCDKERELKAWVMGVNTNLPNSISVLWAKLVDDDFHARYSAQSRRYRYVILNQATRPALLDRLVTWEYVALNLQKMQHAAQHLLGTHDFTSYRAVACQAESSIRTIDEITLSKHDEFIFMDICANGFLHHMVRNIMGVLIDIGKGEFSENWSLDVLQKCDRTLGGVTAPAAGLYLVKVQYDKNFGLDTRIKWPAIANG